MNPTATESDFIASNKNHFDKMSDGYRPSRSSLELAKRIGRAIRRRHDLDDETSEVMDFACGAGLLSQQLAPYVKSIIGVDISPGMVGVYNTFASNQGIPPDEMRAVCADLSIAGAPGSAVAASDESGLVLAQTRFDVIVCALAYHHFPDIADMTRRLASYLKPDGSLIVVDLLKAAHVDMDQLFPEHQGQIVAHRGGFTLQAIEEAFAEAGLENVVLIPDGVAVKKGGQDLSLFIAKGQLSHHKHP